MDLGLRGPAAFVPASSQAMGRAIAERFAAEGVDVGMCARRPELLQEAAATVRAHGVRVVSVVADLADATQGADAVTAAVAELGHLDMLIVNAGGPPPGDFDALDDAVWDSVYGLTLMSAVHLIRAALPALRRSDAASILFVSSSSVRQPIAGLTASNSIRGATAGLARSLADELAPGIRVNTLLPGRIRTERQLELARAAGTASLEERWARLSRDVPLARIGEPAEFARVAVFLSSPAASYVTGAMLA